MLSPATIALGVLSPPHYCHRSLVAPRKVSTCNRLQSYELEVWEWVVKRRILDLFSELSGWVWFVFEFSMNRPIRTFGLGSCYDIPSPLLRHYDL